MPARSLRHPDGRAAILARLDRLTPESQRRWGQMAIGQLIPHLGRGIELALGALGTSATTPGPVRGAILRFLFLRLLPWPKGKIKAPPTAFDTPSLGWNEDQRRLRGLIERFAAAPQDAFAARHPAFGRMQVRDWDLLQYRHLDHHLTQFGV